MKKRNIIISISVGLLLTTMLTACGQSESSLPFSREEAKAIALEHLGVEATAPSYAVVTESGSGDEMNYAVEVLLDGVEYAYSVNPRTGAIEKMTVNNEAVNPEEEKPIPDEKETAYIGLDAAKAIAFKDAGVDASKVTEFKHEMDFAYGKYLYDMQFKVGSTEYEYEVGAESGEIFQKDVDKETVKEPQVEQSTFISVDKAKEIALKHAGVSAKDAKFEKAHWEKEKGSAVYELEFHTSKAEYEYDIHAETGEIIKHSTDGIVTNDSSTGHITPADAKKIAIGHAGVSEADVREYESELDFERGVEVYEISFSVGRTEYDYTIDVKTGKVIQAEREVDD